MNTLDNQYKQLLGTILHNGVARSDRTGTGTISIFGKQITHDMSDGFPILTTKKVAFKTMVTELKWFLKGDTNIKYLQDNNCKIWDGDYKKSGRTDGDLGPIYGKQWRDINGIDQLSNLITNLKNNPTSRRHIVNSWNVSELDDMTLPPCHLMYQCYVADNKLSLMWYQRSVDVFLGLPFNISSYGLLLLLLCEATGYKPGTLVGTLGDTHLYMNHIAAANTQLTREIHTLPSVKLSNVNILDGEFDVDLIDYKHEPALRAPLSN
jgi:thymidylate synthase